MTTTAALSNHPPDISPPDNDQRFDYLHARLQNPNDNDLVDLLDAFYHHFNIGDYLDQIGIIDDRLTDIRDRLLKWSTDYNIHLMGQQPYQELLHIIDLIDHDID